MSLWIWLAIVLVLIVLWLTLSYPVLLATEHTMNWTYIHARPLANIAEVFGGIIAIPCIIGIALADTLFFVPFSRFHYTVRSSPD